MCSKNDLYQVITNYAITTEPNPGRKIHHMIGSYEFDF